MTGNVVCIPCAGPVAGTNAAICSNVDVSACLPFAGVDGNNNEIYQLPDGSLVYSDGTAATQEDIAANCCACLGTPCSPRSCGTSDQPPHATATTPSGNGSGGGMAAPSAGAKPAATIAPFQNCTATKLTQAMSKFGSSIAALLSGGIKTTAKTVLPGQKPVAASAPISQNTFLLAIFIFGGLLLLMAFGHRPEGD